MTSVICRNCGRSEKEHMSKEAYDAGWKLFECYTLPKFSEKEMENIKSLYDLWMNRGNTS